MNMVERCCRFGVCWLRKFSVVLRMVFVRLILILIIGWLLLVRFGRFFWKVLVNLICVSI